MATGLIPTARARAQETFTPLVPISGSIATGEKPQSKLWFHDGRWWAVLASSSVSPTGTWLWRLESDNHWSNVLRLSSSTSAKADTLSLGDVAHVLLQQSSGQLISVQYDALHHTYELWAERPTATAVNLSGSETATFDVDSADRLWVATESGSNVVVWYSDYPYTSFHGPISLENHINSDDICVITALPYQDPPQIGVFWSNQSTDRFGFRVHVDGTDPLLWLADEMPASQSARNFGDGFADDHMNLKIGTDGTLYVAVKTSYNVGGVPHIELLVRRLGGDWDDAYQVNQDGTRPLLLLNEPAKLLRVVDEDSGTIRYRDSPLSSIKFGSQKTLMSGSLNDPTSSKMNWTDQVVVMAYNKGVLIRRTDVTTTTTTIPGATTTTTTRPPTTTTLATTTTSTTTTTLPGGAVTVAVRAAASSDDAEEASAGSVDLTSSDLEFTTDGSKVQTVGMRFPGVPVPPGATILEAWIQFEVDEASTDSTTLRIDGEASPDAAPFTTGARNVSSRARTTAFVANWSPANWTTVGDSGIAQRTPDLRFIVKEIVDRAGWQSNRAMAMIVTGTGHRVARSFDGKPAGAPLLHVIYTTSGGPVTTTTTLPPTTTTTTTPGPTTTSTTTPVPTTTTTTIPPGVQTVEVRVAASNDDSEEAVSNGAIDLASSDLEMTLESAAQIVGIRFRNLTIPRNATIVAAWVQFTVDETGSATTNLHIQGQVGDAAVFSTTARDVSGRARTTAFRDWSPAAWPTVGAAGTDQRTPDLANVVQEIVNGSGWSSGRALALVVTGSGKRVAKAFDGVAAQAALLHVEYRIP